MRSGPLVALLAAGAAAGPLAKRDAVTQYDVVVVTRTVVAGEQATPAGYQAPAPAPAYATPAPGENQHKKQKQAPAPGPAPAPAPGYENSPAPNTQQNSPAPNNNAGSPIPATDDSYSGKILWYHNTLRANHSADALTWDESLAQAARKQAESCTMEHMMNVNGINYGQNLAAQGPDPNVVAGIVDGWYNGEFGYYAPYFGQDNPPDSVFEKLGHFSQMLWKDSKTIGCYTNNCVGSMGMWLTTCNYFPRGNVGGEYGKNVGAPLGHPVCHENSMPAAH